VSAPARVLRRQSLRLRITAAFVASAILLAAILSVATFIAVRRFLEQQRVQTATDEMIVVLQLARDFVADPEHEPDEFVAQLQLRGNYDTIVTAPDDFFPSTISLTPSAIPTSLRTLVERERVGYQFISGDAGRFLVIGGPLPPPETDVFLFFDLTDLEQTMSVLLRVLLVGGFVLVLVAVVLALRVSARILKPVGDVSSAAQRVAEGLLETRVTTATRDEVGVLAASFNQMASAFQDMLDRERRFVANVSHELRTPLATLRTASEMLAAHRDEFPPPSREAVDLLAEDVANLRRLVEELMEVSEVDAGRATIREEEVDLLSLARALVARARRPASVSGEHVVTVSDKARLERILANLLDNAFEHGRGRDVALSVVRDGAGPIVSVSDAGPGIISQDLPHLFDRFFKADHARTRERGGIGLGLAIAMENARLLGGTIAVTSAPDVRTTFTLHLPDRSDALEDAR
jgi:two-component system sensor histidine kinase MtrB